MLFCHEKEIFKTPICHEKEALFCFPAAIIAKKLGLYLSAMGLLRL